jgi:non-specific serine/threonine protein kinase
MAHVVATGQVTGQRRLGLLPAEATGFVGRADELARLASLLGTVRLVTVTGPAGVGKTRLALRAAAQAAGQYRDGVWLVDLGGTDDPGQVAGAVAAALGVTPGREPGPTPVLDHLRGRELLLVLDTCEHLVDACGEFADTVLRDAPGVTLIVTSRQPLDVPGEHAFPLPPLPAARAAVELFAQRAAAVVPGFTVTPGNRADIVRLCRRLDGIPLAIEFAAVRLRALPLPELANQLESGIRTLTPRRRGTSPRHQTLRAAIDWSYQLCSPAERTLWERLSVFAGTFDVSGAEYVCADGQLPRKQVVPALVGLVDKSVVLRDRADPSRYRLLGALREFGADRLADAGGTERFLDRLTARSVAMARAFDERFRDGGRAGGGAPDGKAVSGHGLADQAGALRALRREQENVRAALGHALGAEQQDPGARALSADAAARLRLGADLAVRLSRYWQVSGQLDEGRQWLGRVARLFPESARERAWALGARGQLATFQGDLPGALADIGASIRLATAIGHGAESVVARGYLQLTMALGFAGQHEEALAAAEMARRLLAARGRGAELLELVAQVALLHQLTGNTDEAVACCERGLALLGEHPCGEPEPGEPEPDAPVPGAPVPGARAPGAAGRERWISGYLYLISGLALVGCPGQELATADALHRALAAKHALGDVLGTAYAVEALAWLAARREQPERTAWLLGAADQLWAVTGRRLSGIAVLEESRQHAVDVARETLGMRRYAAAYSRGAALGVDAVVREALDEGGGLPAGADGDGTADGDEAADGLPGLAALLTRREREIAVLVASGLSNRVIGLRLFISKRTVDAHVDHIFGKLEISSRIQLTVMLRELPPGQRS